jgi:hypothetical protein
MVIKYRKYKNNIFKKVLKLIVQKYLREMMEEVQTKMNHLWCLLYGESLEWIKNLGTKINIK